MHHPKAAILFAAVLTLGGCAADSGPKENSGTVIGALSGALIGSAHRRRHRVSESAPRWLAPPSAV